MKRLLFIVLLLAGAIAAPTGPAAAAACSGSSGVTVIVDFDNGSVQQRCAPGDPISGFDALVKAGFTLTYASGNGNGALCSIDQVPDHACPSMPPADAYWAYFHGQPDGGWSYSSYGGGGYNPKPGSVEGWRFRGSPSKKPGIAAPVTSTPRPTLKPSSGPTTAHPAGGASNPVVGPDATSSNAPTAGSTPSASATALATASATVTSTPTATASLTPTSDPTATDVGSAVEAPTRQTSASLASSNHSWIWGVVLVGVLGAAAGATALSRRRT
ncbi:MAG: hypothetical protein ACJ72L_05470 [Marmoricola sp.]